MNSSSILLKLTEEKLAKYKDDIKNLEEMSKTIMNILIKEFEEIFPEILVMPKNQFFKNIKKGVFSTLEDLYTSIFKDDLKIQTLYNNNLKKIEEKYEINYNLLKNEWENYNKNKNEYNYLNKYRKHCFDDSEYASHNCSNKDAKFIQIPSNNSNDSNEINNIEFVICSNCKKVYKSSFILCKCFFCDEEYYSQITSKEENIDLFQATWKKYHCPQLINNKMICIKCKSPFYLNMKTGMLNCTNKNCLFISKPRRISWICNNCKKDFSSGAKVFNPLDVEIIQKVIKQTLLLKHRAHPSKMPCCKLNVFFTEFYHKKNCRGILYLGEMNDELIIVCEKCRAINYYERFIWTCPRCHNKFRIINEKSHNNKNEELDIDENYEFKKDNYLIENKKENKNYHNYKSENKDKYKYKDKFKIRNNYDNKDKSENKDIIENKEEIKKVNSENKEPIENRDQIENKEQIQNKEQTENKEQIENKDKNEDNKDKNKSKDKVEKRYKFKYLSKKEINIKTNKEKDNNEENIYIKNSLKAVIDTPKQNNNNNKNTNQKGINKYQSFRYRRQNRIKTDKMKNVNFLTTDDNPEQMFKTQKNNDENKYNLYFNYVRNSRLNKEENKAKEKEGKNYEENKTVNNENNNEKKPKYFQRLMKLKINDDKNNYIDKRRSVYMHYKDLKQQQLEKENNDQKKEEDYKNQKMNITTIDDVKDKDNKEQDENGKENNIRKRGKFNRFLFLGSSKNSILDNIKKNNQDKSKDKLSILKNSNEDSKRNEKTNNKKMSSSSSSSSFGEKMDDLKNEKSKKSTKVDSNEVNKKERIKEEKENQEEQEIEEFEDTKGIEVDNKNIANKDVNDSALLNSIQVKKIPGMTDHLLAHLTKRINHILANSKIKQFNLEEYSVNRKLGEGSYGIIHCITNEKTKEKFALKKIIAYSLKKIAEFTKEFELVHICQHPNILKIYGLNINILDRTTYSLQVLMEKAERDWDRDIKRRLQERKYYTEEELISIMRQITSALLYMKDKLNITHRDIKPQNVLIFEGGIYKLADFGEAKEIKVSKNLNTLRGTELYMSPALYNGLKVNNDDIVHDPFKSDLFSLGFCLVYAATMNFNLLYDLRNTDNDEQVRRKIKHCLKENYSEKFIEIITKMVELDEKNRYDFKELSMEIEKKFGK